jgi:TatD DNase family protein
MHCYAGPSHLVKRFIALGFYLSYGGPITYKNADEARQSVSKTPIDRLLIETDSPFLSPHPLRGKQNSPINLPIIFDKLKMLTQLPTDQLTKQLYDNTLKAFHVKTL